MPIELQIIRANEFVCVDTEEQLDFEASKKALQLLAHACRKRGLDRAMLDLRATPVPERALFTPAQLAALVRAFRDAGFGRQQRLALLYREDPHGGARMFASISRIQGRQVSAFRDFETAFRWLSEGKTSAQAEPRETEEPIPISKGGGKKLANAAAQSHRRASEAAGYRRSQSM